MKYSHINQITSNEVKSLIENKVPENTHLEYKREIKFSIDSEKKELLADVCSFANLGGGVIIYGIEDEKDDNQKNTGVPKEVIGLKINADETIRQLEESIRKNIEPVLIGITLASREIDGKQVLVLFIPKSSNSPHRVSFKNFKRFWKRGGNSKYEMSIEELRTDFLSGFELFKRISKFRSERITKISSNDTFVPFVNGPKLVLHIIPLNFFDKNHFINVSKLNESDDFKFPVICNYHHHLTKRLNFDGLFYLDSVRISSDGFNHQWSNYTYVQIFRNSVVEEVVGREEYNPGTSVFLIDGNLSYIDPSVYEKKIIKALKTYREFLIRQEISGPCIVFLSFLNVRGYKISKRTYSDGEGNQGIDREVLLLPDIYIEDINNFSASDIMKPAFDMIWNAGNFSGSENYDENGKWIQEKNC